MSLYADIIIDIDAKSLDKTFQYRVPPELEERAKIGSQALIPFGSRKTEGIITGLSDTPLIDESRIKDIIDIPEKLGRVSPDLIKLSVWMKEHYACTMNQALRTCLPVRVRSKEKTEKFISPCKDNRALLEIHADLLKRKNHSKGKERFLEALIKYDGTPIPWDALVSRLCISSSIIREAEKKGLVEISEKRLFRTGAGIKNDPDEKINELNPAQKKALEEFKNGYENGEKKPFLLYGVTGSGKTEVYIRMIEHVLSKGRQAIVLIPEISLTYQTLMRFYARFKEKVSVIHSRLSNGERSDRFEAAKEGRISVMIGPRSALFTPFPDTGMIIIDEEQETSYKSENVPKYHAREVAEKRAKICNAALVLGSATPSLEAYESAKRDEYKTLTLPERVSDRALAETQIIDMREELKSGNRSMISRALDTAIKETLRKNEKIMLFLNRRGFMGFISCRACGHVIKCPHCDVSLTLHKDGRLHCHYCGFERDNVKACESCGSKLIGTFKAGTEKVEDALIKKYEGIRVLRMDADTTKGKDSHEKILSAFHDGQADILLGTQMIVKGHDFSDVTLMGILAADMSLNASDFRSAERTFDLITQACGRAGRGEKKGHVIIQTYRPESYAIRTAAAQDYEAFFKEEESYRRLMSYPPFSHILLLQLFGEKKEKVAEAAERAYSIMKEKKDGLFIMRPRDAALSKLNDVFRMAVTVKDDDRELLSEAAAAVSKAILSEPVFSGVTINFDFDPVSGF